MKWDDFKITEHLKPGHNTIPDYTEPDSLYNCVNLMVFLLHDIPYRMVYGNVRVFINALAENVKGLPIDHPQMAVLSKLIRKIQNELPSNSDLELRLFFEKEVPLGHPHRPVLDKFMDAAADEDGDGDLLCMPFLRIQVNKQFIKSSDMDNHIKWVGPFSLHELFALPKYVVAKGVIEAIKRAREIGIFSEPYHPGQPFQVLDNRIEPRTGGNNNRICSGGFCIVHQNAWCSTAAGENCSAMSQEE